MSRVHSAILVLQSLLEGEDRLDLLGGNQLDRRHLVRGAEAIEEVQEGNAAVDAVGDIENACCTQKDEPPKPNREPPAQNVTTDRQIQSMH